MNDRDEADRLHQSARNLERRAEKCQDENPHRADHLRRVAREQERKARDEEERE